MEQEPSRYSPAHSLAAEVEELRQRVELLEQTLARLQDTPTSIVGSVVSSEPAELAPREGNHPPDLPVGKPSALESRIGAQWFNWIGTFAVLAAAAWFLKLAIDREWIGPGLRVTIGLIAAAAIVAGSERFRRTGSLSFSYTLKALGSAIAYLSLWAASNLYHLWPEPLAFSGMIAVTVANAGVAWRQNSELLAVLALAGGMATPALLAIGGEEEIFLLSYLLLLNMGALALAASRPWRLLMIGAFAGTTLYLGFLSIEHLHRADRAVEGIFVAVFFLCFTMAPFLTARLMSKSRLSGWLAWMPMGVAVVTFLEARYLSTPYLDKRVSASVAAALAVVSLLIVAGVRRKDDTSAEAQGGTSLENTHLYVAAVFFALASLLAFNGYGIPLCWLTEMVVLAAAAARWRSHTLGRALLVCATALLLLAFAGLGLLESYDPATKMEAAFFNVHFATYLLGLICLGSVVVISRVDGSDGRLKVRDRVLNLQMLAALAIVAFNIIALLSVSIQIRQYWILHTLTAAVAGHRPVVVDFTYSAWFMIYGGMLMAVGLSRRSAFFRWQALILLSLSIGKAFLYDTSHLNEGYRIFSFLGLGVLLLAISFVYQRGRLRNYFEK